MLEAIDYTSDNAAQEFARSLKEIGFAVLKNHPLEKTQVTHLYQQWQGFYSSEAKFDYAFNKDRQDGFFSTEKAETAKGASVKDIKEYFHFYPWGQCPENLKPDTLKYYQQANQLACTLLTWVEQYTPAHITDKLSEPLSNMILDSDMTMLRILHYPPFAGTEAQGAIRAAAHEDINLLTILPAATQSGLQVKDKNGHWLDVPAEFGYLIINTGDMLQEACEHYYPSTTHRVVNPTGEATTQSRISMPLFLHARPDVVLSERYTAGSYLKQRLKELGVE
ncbi:2OG-Fe(II) oxygenase family protein [Catenovulum agarivorans]|uniref:2OG-Fe(II) oxygenase family protein n=1 Tax=Catenovulum agarivorans TaxID=1172192 RepID=UPI0002FB9B40|nr:2OG-Fe(II) oxygenase family protein [Catenovulum agarivorans]